MSEANGTPDALIEQRGHTLIVTLNRPEARNALSTEMLSIMVEAWDRVDSDPEIRTCILTGAGGTGFFRQFRNRGRQTFFVPDFSALHRAFRQAQKSGRGNRQTAIAARQTHHSGIGIGNFQSVNFF